MNLQTNVPYFVRKTIRNGIILSTCLLCARVMGSPTTSKLKIAEQSHNCIGELSMCKRAQA